jgi:5'-nucleotidase
MFNKNETALDNPNYFRELSHRGNALVLGDSLGDVSMDKGMHDPGAVLKIGFLNDKINERMDSFINAFDMVLVDDQSFRFIDILTKKIAPAQVKA